MGQKNVRKKKRPINILESAFSFTHKPMDVFTDEFFCCLFSVRFILLGIFEYTHLYVTDLF